MKRTKAKELLNKVCYNGRTYYVRHVEGNEEGTQTHFGEEYTNIGFFFKLITTISRDHGAVTIRTLNDMQKLLDEKVKRIDWIFKMTPEDEVLDDEDLKRFKRYAMTFNYAQRSIDSERREILKARAKDKEEIANGTGYGNNEWRVTTFGR